MLLRKSDWLNSAFLSLFFRKRRILVQLSILSVFCCLKDIGTFQALEPGAPVAPVFPAGSNNRVEEMCLIPSVFLGTVSSVVLDKGAFYQPPTECPCSEPCSTPTAKRCFLWWGAGRDLTLVALKCLTTGHEVSRLNADRSYEAYVVYLLPHALVISSRL